MKGLLDSSGSSIFTALLSCRAFRCALDSFNNRNRAKRDYRIVWKNYEMSSCFRKQYIYIYIRSNWKHVYDRRSSSKRLRKRNDLKITWRKGRWIHVRMYTRIVLLPQLSFPSLFEDTINNRPFRSQKGVIESCFLSAPTFEAILWKRLVNKITSKLRKLVQEISYQPLPQRGNIFTLKIKQLFICYNNLL